MPYAETESCPFQGISDHCHMYQLNHPKISCSRESFTELSSFIESTIPFYDMVVDHANLEADSLKILQLVFPAWFSDDNELEVTQCKDGITNKLMKIKNLNDGETVLIRAYGKKSHLIIDRPQELVNFVTLSIQNLSPPIYARFTNGFVYGYIDGVAMSIHDMAEPTNSRLIAKKIAHWHRIEVPGEPLPRLFRTLRKWFLGLPKSYSNEIIQKAWEESGITHEWLLKQVTVLEYKLTMLLTSPIVFCHNDLLSANIIRQENDVSFIDYEYGSQNYRGFDIGNHFCEYAGFECKYDEFYPSKEAQMIFLQAYLAEIKGCQPAELELEQLYLEVNVFALTSHMFWGLWALIQASLSDIQFDYMGYAIRRFNRYKATKHQWLSQLDQNS